jgi:hypothetical protein
MKTNTEKKHTGRFCIQFNISDSQHVQAIRLLETQGRRKAAYITEAILHYDNCTMSPQAKNQNDISAIRPVIESVVRELAEKGKLVINGKHNSDIACLFCFCHYRPK